MKSTTFLLFDLPNLARQPAIESGRFCRVNCHSWVLEGSETLTAETRHITVCCEM